MTNTVQIVSPECMFCGEVSHIPATAEQATALAIGTLTQLVFPDMPPATREVLISGTHPDCWDSEFGSSED